MLCFDLHVLYPEAPQSHFLGRGYMHIPVYAEATVSRDIQGK